MRGEHEDRVLQATELSDKSHKIASLFSVIFTTALLHSELRASCSINGLLLYYMSHQRRKLFLLRAGQYDQLVKL